MPLPFQCWRLAFAASSPGCVFSFAFIGATRCGIVRLIDCDRVSRVKGNRRDELLLRKGTFSNFFRGLRK